MYHHQSNSSSSPRRGADGHGGLTRFASAPVSFLTRFPDGSPPSPQLGTGPSHRAGQYHQHFSGDSSSLTSESTCKVSPSAKHEKSPERFLEIGHGEPSLVRQKSSPAGFFNYLVSENGFSITRGSGSGRLKPQLNLSRQDSLSQISEGSESGVEGLSSEQRRQRNSYIGVQSWEQGSSITFSGKRRNGDVDFFSSLSTFDTQFSLPQTNLEMSSMDKLLDIPEDSVPCKIRAKRGCATHPRSIAERERRTRISGKLKKLQELVPNMDKQTSYADMLDLAVQHIKGLQKELQRLRTDIENCTCGCKPAS